MRQTDDSGKPAHAGIAGAVGADTGPDAAASHTSELQHRLISHLIPAYAFSYRVGPDRAVTLEWITPGAKEVIGYTEAELKGDVRFRNCIHPEDRARHQAALDQIVDGNPVTMEFRFLTKGGAVRWLQCCNRTEWSADGKRVVRIYGAAQDVTDRKHTEETLRIESERLDLALEVARLGKWEWDFATNAVRSDARLIAMFGGPDAKAFSTETEFRQFIHPEDAPAVDAAIRSAVNGNDHFHANFRVVWRDGSIRWLEGRGSVFRDAAGKALRMVGVTADITERKHAEEALRASEQQFASLVNNIDGIVWEAEVETMSMTFVSYQAERILGYPLKAWHESKTFWRDHIHPDDRDKAVNFSAAQTRLGRSHDFEYRMVAADGRIVWMRDLVMVTMKNERAAGLHGIMVDITRLKQSELQAEESTRRLQFISRQLIELQESERRHLARELHDEIGQTLTATKIILENIRASRPPAVTPLLTNAVQHVDHLLHIVRDLSLNLRPPMLDDFGLVSALRWLLDQHHKTTGRTVELDSDYQVETPDATIETACFRTAQEALTNVTRHARAKKVSVRLHTGADGIHLAVTDDGVGFDVEAARGKSRHGGSLGLLNMQERAALVGGRLDVISAPGGGTEIRARFPLTSRPAPATT
jgi:PAS domain S-box-containing protein